ncbi:hypothetical protein C1909_00400 [Listeria ivanovii]|uniref:glycan biosynthesis hexose transferase WsfD n=1 Tax=Listeria ivanovii TaxID=1638 RepID=UPI000DAA0B7D|nr:hypothetical protein [Listeria ivanovii]PZG54643.1 hypothetical protein C1909_00400 [Listeria ivanovii]
MKRKFQSISMWLWHHLTPQIFAVICVFIITILGLFIPPYIGMADNGDFFRIFSSNGLFVNNADYDALQFGHFVKEFGIYQYFNENQVAIYSSQSVFIQIALVLNKIFWSTTVFDIRFLGGLQLALLLPAIYLLVAGLTVKMKGWPGYLIAGLTVFIFADTAYTAYFNSFFSEGLILIMMLYITAGFLLLFQHKYNDYVMLGLIFVVSLVLITAKQQNAPIAVVIVVCGIIVFFIRKDRVFRIATAVIFMVIFMSGVVMYAFIPGEFVTINQYQTMTRGVLLDSENPEKSLQEMGINEQFALLKGTNFYQKYKLIDLDNELMQKEFYPNYNFVSVLGYYLENSKQFGKMLDLSAQNSFSIRPFEMGNFEKMAGYQFKEKTHFFSAYSDAKAKLAPEKFSFLILWALLFLICYGLSAIKAFRAKDFRGMLLFDLIVLLIGSGFAVILVTIVGDGEADLTKHNFLFNVCFDLTILIGAASLLSIYLKRRGEKHA